MKSIYKNNQAKKQIFDLYDEKLKFLGIDIEEIDINTSFGKTRVIKSGNEKGKIVVLFHGINAGSPITLEAVKELRDKYNFKRLSESRTKPLCRIEKGRNSIFTVISDLTEGDIKRTLLIHQ